MSIQYLRATAALMVVFNHAFQDQFTGFQSLFPTGMGAAGVDLFFVISGFIMVHITASQEREPLTFLISRVLRIGPIYWLYTAAAALLLFLVPWLFRSNVLTTSHFILSLLFIPHDTAINPGVLYPVIKVGWTLNYEMFFYVLFAIAIWISFKRRVEISSFALLSLTLAGHVYGGMNNIAHFLGNSIMLEFVYGMIIAKLYCELKSWPINVAAGAFLTFVGFLLLLLAMHLGLRPRGLFVGIPAAAVAFGAATLEREKLVDRRWLPLLLGDASYSIYLVHLFVIAMLRVMWSQCNLPTQGWGFGLTFVATCLIGSASIGVASYRLIEKPLGSSLRNLLQMIARFRKPTTQDVDA